MTFTTALIISAIIFGVASGVLIGTKLSYNSMRRRDLKSTESKLTGKLEKMKTKNMRYYRLSAKLARVRIKLNKYHVASFAETTDTSSLTRGERKKYFRMSRLQNKLSAHQERVRGHISKDNKVKETKLKEKIAKYESKLPLPYASKVMPGTYLDLGAGVDNRNGIFLGNDNTAREKEFIGKIKDIAQQRFSRYDKNFTHVVQIESPDDKINGMCVSSSYKRIARMGEREILDVVNTSKSAESYPIIVNKITKNSFGKAIDVHPIKIRNEKEFATYMSEMAPKREPEMETTT